MTETTRRELREENRELSEVKESLEDEVVRLRSRVQELEEESSRRRRRLDMPGVAEYEAPVRTERRESYRERDYGRRGRRDRGIYTENIDRGYSVMNRTIDGSVRLIKGTALAYIDTLREVTNIISSVADEVLSPIDRPREDRYPERDEEQESYRYEDRPRVRRESR